jgi:hypothetical protein
MRSSGFRLEEDNMTSSKAMVLASVLGGEVEATMPQSRMPGVRLSLPDGRVCMIDERGGATYRSDADLEAYSIDGDDRTHVAIAAEWPRWGLSEEWARPLASLIGGEAYQSGGNIWVVLFDRPDGRYVVVGDDGAELYESAAHYERYYERTSPEPAYVYWTNEEQ